MFALLSAWMGAKKRPLTSFIRWLLLNLYLRLALSCHRSVAVINTLICFFLDNMSEAVSVRNVLMLS